MGYEDEYEGGDGGGNNPLIGWIVMGLIGLGIFILYKTTGILIIPIPRK